MAEKEYKNEVQEIDDSVNPVPRTEVKNVWGFFETVSAVPTLPPTNFQQQIKFYKNSTTYRIYMYDITNKAWRYSSLT